MAVRGPADAGRRPNIVVAVVAVVLLAALVVFGLELHATQSSSRATVVARFQDRAQVVASLMQAEISSVATSTAATPAYSGAVTRRALDQIVRQSHLAYAVVLNDQRQIIAASGSVTPSDRTRILTGPAVGRVLQGAPVELGDVVGAAGGGQGAVVELVVDLKADAGVGGHQVLVAGLPGPVLSAFLGTYLQRLATAGGIDYMLDSHGVVVGSSDPRLTADGPVADPALQRAVSTRRSGAYAGGRYFVTASVPDTMWRVVLTAEQRQLLSSVSGSRKWLPWGIYIAFFIVALGCVALLRRLLGNATQLRAANEQLAAGNARLQSTNLLLRRAAELSRSNAELEQFASIASHDLQEPLRKVQTFAAQLTSTEHDRLSEQGQDFLRRMTDAAGRMRTLIDDLLMFSRVTTQGRPFTPVDLGDVARQVLVDLEVAIEEAGARVTVEPLPTIQADPLQMRQLLQNLIANALKFRRADVTPEVRLGADVDEHVAEVTVEDNGIGFDPQYATRIFRAFERLHGARTYPGTGIGLALCRKIAERHHGTITAQSTPGEGTTFTVRLPVEQAADVDEEPRLFPEEMLDTEVSEHAHA